MNRSARLPSLSSLRAFECAARLCSFKQAAEELSVTATAISHRIRVLEADLGHTLFHRKVRSVELTPEGQVLFSAVHAGFEAIAAGVSQLRAPTRGAVTVSVTPAFAAKWLVPRLDAFQAAHPDINLHVHASNDVVRLGPGSADLAVRYGKGPYPGLDATALMQDRFAPVASPALGAISSEQIAESPLIHFDWHRGSANALSWAAWAQAAGMEAPPLAKCIRFSEESHAIQAAVAGQGVALVSLLLVQEELKLGLLRVVPGPSLEGWSYNLVAPPLETASAQVVAVRDWLIEASKL